MEKMMWSKPEMNEFAFAANEYVASSCGDGGATYNFKCNAPVNGNVTTLNGFTGDELYYYRDAKVDAGVSMPTDWDNMEKTSLGVYHPCDQTHSAPVSDEYYWGFVDNDNDGKHDSVGDLIETVIVWVEKKWFTASGHATKNLNIKTWQIAKS